MGMKGQKFMNQLEALTTYDEVANTNLEGVFDLILQVVLEYELSQEALPVKSLIISVWSLMYVRCQNSNKSNGDLLHLVISYLKFHFEI